MVGERSRSVYRKSRKRKAFFGTQKQAKIRQDTSSKGMKSEASTSSGGSTHENQTNCAGALRKKITFHGYEESSDEDDKNSEDIFGFEEDEVEGEGYRLMDLNNLSSAISEVHKCEEG